MLVLASADATAAAAAPAAGAAKLACLCFTSPAAAAAVPAAVVVRNKSQKYYSLARSPLRLLGSADIVLAACWLLQKRESRTGKHHSSEGRRLLLLLLLLLLFLRCCCSWLLLLLLLFLRCCCSCRAINQPPRRETNSQTSCSKLTRNSKTPPNFVPKMAQNRSKKVPNVSSEILENPRES